MKGNVSNQSATKKPISDFIIEFWLAGFVTTRTYEYRFVPDVQAGENVTGMKADAKLPGWGTAFFEDQISV